MLIKLNEFCCRSSGGKMASGVMFDLKPRYVLLICPDIAIAISVWPTARQQNFTMKAGTVTYERCEELSTLIDDTADDNFIEVSCSVTSYPKSILTWTTDPINRRGYPIKETNKVRITPLLRIKPLLFARMKIFFTFSWSSNNLIFYINIPMNALRHPWVAIVFLRRNIQADCKHFITQLYCPSKQCL